MTSFDLVQLTSLGQVGVTGVTLLCQRCQTVAHPRRSDRKMCHCLIVCVRSISSCLIIRSKTSQVHRLPASTTSAFRSLWAPSRATTTTAAPNGNCHYLWPPYVIGGPLYFCPVVSFFLSIYLLFFPRLISAATDWMSTILLHMAWP